METKVRAKVLIPVLLFLAMAIPAILIPTIPRHQAEPPSHTTYDTIPTDPLWWENRSEPPNIDWQLEPGDLEEYLERLISE